MNIEQRIADFFDGLSDLDSEEYLLAAQIGEPSRLGHVLAADNAPEDAKALALSSSCCLIGA